MRPIVDSKIEGYIASLEAEADPVRAGMESRARETGFPIVGPQVGRLLGMLARFAGARQVLELGSGYGYSALWFARSFADGGMVTCTDLSEENKDLAMSYFNAAGLTASISFTVGDALSFARTLAGPFDIVFNDIDKEQYPNSIEVALRLLRPGGLFITDNVLWDGKVTGSGRADPTTQAIREFNRMITDRRDVQTVFLPVRDGVAVCQKVG